MIDCEFWDPINLNTTTTPDFEFSKLNCTSTLIESVLNSTTGAEFYLSKTIDYGDVVIFWFFTLGFLLAIFTFIFKLFWKK